MHLECTGFGTVEALIGDFDRLPALDGAYYGRQPVLAGGNLFEEDTVAQIAAFDHHIAQRQGVEHPLTDAVIRQVFSVGDIVSQRAVAFDLNTEGIENGLTMIVESTFREIILAEFVKRAARPEAADVAERNISIAVDGIDQPDVTLEVVLCHILFVLPGPTGNPAQRYG